MTDCYSRKGQLINALKLIQQYEQITDKKDHHYKMWMALFAGCKKYKNIHLGNRVYHILTDKFGVEIEQLHKL